jgi:hypothetical protein
MPPETRSRALRLGTHASQLRPRRAPGCFYWSNGASAPRAPLLVGLGQAPVCDEGAPGSASICPACAPEPWPPFLTQPRGHFAGVWFAFLSEACTRGQGLLSPRTMWLVSQSRCLYRQCTYIQTVSAVYIVTLARKPPVIRRIVGGCNTLTCAGTAGCAPVVKAF